MSAGFVELHRLTNAARSVWVNVDTVCLVSDEGSGHARLRLCDAMVLDVDEPVPTVLGLIAAAGTGEVG